MANVYDIEGMKSGKEKIEYELRNFQREKEKLDRIMQTVVNQYFIDDTSRRFIQRYNREAKKNADELEDMLVRFVNFLGQCTKKYSNAIDNGNSNLSL